MLRRGSKPTGVAESEAPSRHAHSPLERVRATQTLAGAPAAGETIDGAVALSDHFHGSIRIDFTFAECLPQASREIKIPHHDPTDRLLAATARFYGLRLVTADERLLEGTGFSTLSN